MKHNLISRRNMMVAGVAFGAGTASRGFASDMPFAGLSADVISEVRRIADGRSLGLRLLLPEGSQDNLAPVIAAFTAGTGIEIESHVIGLEDINTTLILNGFAAGRPYDVALPATFGMPDLVEAGVLRPLSDFARRYEPEGLREGILFDVGDRYDGEIYGFQTDGDTYVMFYNADMMDDPSHAKAYQEQHGQPLEIPKTWDELDRQMAFFHRPAEGMYGGSLYRISGYLAWEWWVRFHAKGVWPFGPDLTPQISGAEGVAALNEMLAASAYQVPEVQRLGLFANWERFGRGDVYCNIGWGGTQKYLNRPGSRMRGKLKFGPTPGGRVAGEILNTPYFNWGWDYVVTQASPEPEIAYLFTLFANAPDISAQAIGAAGGFFDPIREEHYTDSKIREVYSEPFLKVHRESLRSSIPDLYIANQSEYLNVLNYWLDTALNDRVTAKVALDRVAQEWSLITIRAGVDRQMSRWEKLRQKYPEAARRLLRDL